MSITLRALFSASMLIGLAACNPPLPAIEKTDKVVLLDQGAGWDRHQYYTTAQGTVMLPVDWWFSMEEPSSQTLLSDKGLLERFGFIVNDMQPDSPDMAKRLPVGMTLQSYTDPQGRVQNVVGVTCAACHTGQLNYNGTAVRIDGGQSMANFALLQSTIGKSVITTYLEPAKFKRFAERVLARRGEIYDEANKQGIRAELAVAFKLALAQAPSQTKNYPVEEGFGRLDALQRIANTLLADDLRQPENNRPATAPVSFPHLWSAPYFDWVQWNGSVRQPMIRNVGEALGVRAATNFVANDGLPTGQPQRWWTSIPVHNLHAIEQNLRKLQPPKWPEQVLGKLDMAKAEKGRDLFQANCAGCHGWAWVKSKQWNGKPVHTDWPDPRFRDALIQTKTVGVEVVGTDPTLLNNFNTRTYDASRLGWFDGNVPPKQDPGFNDDGTTYYPAGTKDPYGTALSNINAGMGLWAVTQLVKTNLYTPGQGDGVPAEQWADYDGWGLANEVRATCGYKATPLDGVWATPPFLHNGSVPTIWHLLSKPEERPSVFWVGNREFDPVKLGYVWSDLKNGTRIDTTTIGNSNAGHAFSDTPGPGVIGRALAEDEKLAIMEYLKAMDRFPPVTRPVDPNADRDYPCAGKLPYYSNAKAY